MTFSIEVFTLIIHTCLREIIFKKVKKNVSIVDYIKLEREESWNIASFVLKDTNGSVDEHQQLYKMHP